MEKKSKQCIWRERKKYENNEDFNKCYITLHFSCNVEWCVEKKLFLSPSIYICVAAQCTVQTHLPIRFFSVRVSSLRMLYILSVYCIHWNNSSLNSHYHCNELVRTMNSRGKINILNKKWKWNATMHNESFFSLSFQFCSTFRITSFNFKLFYFTLKLNTIFAFITFHFVSFHVHVNFVEILRGQMKCGICLPAFAL